jgi:hypothetical protein
MTDTRRSRIATLAAGVCLLSLVLAALGLAISIAIDAGRAYEGKTSLPVAASDTAIGLSFALVGGLIAFKRPGHLVGWSMLLAGGAGMIGTNLFGLYAQLAVLARPEWHLPAGLVAQAIGSGGWAFLMLSVFLLVLLFPAGSIPSPRWRLPSRLVPVGFVIVWLVLATAPEFDKPFDTYHNPLSFTEDDSYIVVVFALIAACLLTTAAAAINLIARFWRSAGDEREQYKWLAFAAALLIVSFPFAAVGNYSGLGGALVSVALIALPVALGVAVLKYRLYEIDLLINRTLVYVPLTAILVGLYTAVVGVLKTIVTDETHANTDTAVALTTVLVVAILTPVKNLLQSVVDRAFKEQDGALVRLHKLSSGARAVTQVLDRTRFIEQFLEQLMVGLGADGAKVEFAGNTTPAITTGVTGSALAHVLPLTYGDRMVGSLSVWPGPRTTLSLDEMQQIMNDAANVLAEVISLTPVAAATSSEPAPEDKLQTTAG